MERTLRGPKGREREKSEDFIFPKVRINTIILLSGGNDRNAARLRPMNNASGNAGGIAPGMVAQEPPKQPPRPLWPRRPMNLNVCLFYPPDLYDTGNPTQFLALKATCTYNFTSYSL